MCHAAWRKDAAYPLSRVASIRRVAHPAKFKGSPLSCLAFSGSSCCHRACAPIALSTAVSNAFAAVSVWSGGRVLIKNVGRALMQARIRINAMFSGSLKRSRRVIAAPLFSRCVFKYSPANDTDPTFPPSAPPRTAPSTFKPVLTRLMPE